jgi:hypothetical protein
MAGAELQAAKHVFQKHRRPAKEQSIKGPGAAASTGLRPANIISQRLLSRPLGHALAVIGT